MPVGSSSRRIIEPMDHPPGGEELDRLEGAQRSQSRALKAADFSQIVTKTSLCNRSPTVGAVRGTFIFNGFEALLLAMQAKLG